MKQKETKDLVDTFSMRLNDIHVTMLKNHHQMSTVESNLQSFVNDNAFKQVQKNYSDIYTEIMHLRKKVDIDFRLELDKVQTQLQERFGRMQEFEVIFKDANMEEKFRLVDEKTKEIETLIRKNVMRGDEIHSSGSYGNMYSRQYSRQQSRFQEKYRGQNSIRTKFSQVNNYKYQHSMRSNQQQSVLNKQSSMASGKYMKDKNNGSMTTLHGVRGLNKYIKMQTETGDKSTPPQPGDSDTIKTKQIEFENLSNPKEISSSIKDKGENEHANSSLQLSIRQYSVESKEIRKASLVESIQNIQNQPPSTK